MGLRDTNTNPYEIQRKQVSQRLQAQGQQQSSALNRRFAQLGGGPSGAAIKAQQNLESELGQQREEALGNIAAQEAVAQREDEKFNKQFGLQERAQKASEEQFGKQFGLQEKGFGLQERGMGLQEQQLAENIKQGEFGRSFADKQFSAERADQAFNKSVSAAQLKGSQLGRFSKFYNQFNQGDGELKGGTGSLLNTDPYGGTTLVGGLSRDPFENSPTIREMRKRLRGV